MAPKKIQTSTQPSAYPMKLFIISLAFVVAINTFAESPAPVPFQIERTVAHQGFDGNKCWVHARAGAIPPQTSENESTQPLVVMTMQKLLLSGSDVFDGLSETRLSDSAETWSNPTKLMSFARQVVSADPDTLPTGASIAPSLIRPGDETTVCDFTPKWHVASERLLGLGQTVWYRDNRVMRVRPRGVAYAVYDASKASWSPWKTLKLPDQPKFQSAGSGSVQRVDLPGGDILLPIYFKEPLKKQYSTTVCRCRFDGHRLEYVQHGSELTIAIDRGLYEPSLTYFQGRYFLTLRNDQRGYICTSEDGLHFDSPRPWRFDDGSDLGNYNTQQHWITHRDALYLVYTRRGANNDHVMRHRAPLFIAQVDPKTLRVIRETEQVLVPQRGARLGNFGVTTVSPEETWVTVTEWMQPAGVEKHGSDNSVYVVKLKWGRPNTGQPQRDAKAVISPYFSPPARWQNETGKYRSPLQFDDGSIAKTSEDWRRRRAEILAWWQERLGKWPALVEPATFEILQSVHHEDFTQHEIRFRWTPTESTTGYLLIPHGAIAAPAVLSVYYEPETSIGIGKPHRDFGLQLARRGFVSLSIGTTEASQAQTYSLYYPSIENAEIQPLSMLGYAAANAWHCLAGLPEVDSSRIGIVGHSFGGKWAMFAACLFDKFACGAWSDPGVVFDDSRPSINYWEPWYLGYHPKPWRKRGLITRDNPARGLYPKLVAARRDLHELHALMAPRPFLVSGGSEDPLERWEVLNHSIAVNDLLGYENRVVMTNRPEHSPNADSNQVLYAFFEHFLEHKRSTH